MPEVTGFDGYYKYDVSDYHFETHLSMDQNGALKVISSLIKPSIVKGYYEKSSNAFTDKQDIVRSNHNGHIINEVRAAALIAAKTSLR